MAPPCLTWPLRVTGGELFDRIVEKGSYSEKDAADLIKQVGPSSKRHPPSQAAHTSKVHH